MADLVEKKPNGKFGMIMAVYLVGIFMGAIDTGIVTPARTVIQNGFGIDAQTGIWMITIYTLAYAASVPIMGKQADRHGRKFVYILCISLFGIGSLFCGLSANFGGFPLLLAARVVQAIGGGGIVPIATAEFGTTFPPEKRGMALGMVGGVYGIANVFGASAGSAIMDIFGTDNWSYIFYINVPISLFVVIAGFLALQNHRTEVIKKIDIGGIFTLTVMILSLLYAIKNIDFFDFVDSVKTVHVYPFLIVFLLLVPMFIFTEKRAADPVLSLRYFTNRNLLVTMLLSTISGFVMMGVIFVPQFSENALKIATGSGGYLVIILGVAAGLGAPLSGRMIDKFGAKVILALGFGFSIAGALFMIFVTIPNPNMKTVMIGLILSGFGMGFTMGTPINYMVLANTDTDESNTALAAVSLVRSIGTAIAPAIMAGFLAVAGLSVQDNVMTILPDKVSVPPLPYAQEISDKFAEMKKDPDMKDKLKKVNIPDVASMTTVNIDMEGDSDYKMPKELQEKMENSDVTTITANTKEMAETMFNEMKPDLVKDIQDGIGSGEKSINDSIPKMKSSLTELQSGIDGISKGIDGMEQGIAGQKTAVKKVEDTIAMLEKMGVTKAPPGKTILDMMPPPAKAKMPKEAQKQLKGVHSVDELKAQKKQLADGIADLEAKAAKSREERARMREGAAQLKSSIAEMEDMSEKMAKMKKAVPGAFDKALENYEKKIDEKAGEIEESFRSTLNVGFKKIYLTSIVAAFLAMLLLMFYSKKRETK